MDSKGLDPPITITPESCENPVMAEAHGRAVRIDLREESVRRIEIRQYNIYPKNWIINNEVFHTIPHIQVIQ